jgi:hypothetical protein
LGIPRSKQQAVDILAALGGGGGRRVAVELAAASKPGLAAARNFPGVLLRLPPQVFPPRVRWPIAAAKPKEIMCLTESDPDHKVTKLRETPHQIT